MVVQVGYEVILDHGSDGKGEEQWTDLRYIYKSFVDVLDEGRGL